MSCREGVLRSSSRGLRFRLRFVRVLSWALLRSRTRPNREALLAQRPWPGELWAIRRMYPRTWWPLVVPWWHVLVWLVRPWLASYLSSDQAVAIFTNETFRTRLSTPSSKPAVVLHALHQQELPPTPHGWAARSGLWLYACCHVPSVRLGFGGEGDRVTSVGR
jgi:hypothetical protein